MTENEREEILRDIRDGYIDEWDNLTIDELFKEIEKEHKEVQAYRAIGTVEDFKALKEKNEPKKVDEEYCCPICHTNLIGNEKRCGMKQRAIYTGFSQHDSDAYYKCPVCNSTFSGWDVFHNQKNENGSKKYCPNCKTELDGLE